MAGRAFKVGTRIKGVYDYDGFNAIRKATALEALFHKQGDEWVERLNEELHAAQAKRKQPVEDGYTYHVHQGHTRVRMYVVAATARAQAHERKHSSILKLMHTSGWDVKSHGEVAKAAAKTKARKTREERRRKAREADLSPSELPPHNLDQP